jgi:Cu-Zn family superoxide dismutase
MNKSGIGILRFAAFILAGCASAEGPADVGSTEQDLRGGVARTTLHDASGNVVGDLLFVPSHGGTEVSASVHIDPSLHGWHGLHVHANNNPANGDGCIADPTQPANTFFVSADGHFDGGIHGDHRGDMPPMLVNTDGTGSYSFVTDRFSPADVAGRAVIFHALPDNFHNIPLGTAANQYTANSQDAITLTDNTGNAGNRIACGVIE